MNRKLVEAAARTHLETGLTIASHTSDGVAALDQLDVLAEEGVSASAWIWVHAQKEPDHAFHKRVAKAGAWVELDGIKNKEKPLAKHLAYVKTLQEAGLLERVLLSHDAGWYTVGQLRGGEIRGFTALFKAFIPMLKEFGLSEGDIKQLIVTNPANALGISVRTA